jgi:four helix bundle protein
VNQQELQERTKWFAVEVIRLVEALPKTQTAEVLGKQLLRSATSVAANYRAACRGRSRAEFVSKINVVEEEADESEFWLELLVEANVVARERVLGLLKEAGELTAIFVATGRTAKQKR